MASTADLAIAAAFDLHASALLLYARQWVDRAAAEDVVQQVFLKLIAGNRVPDDYRTWLFRCVRNEAISASRSAGRRGRRERRRQADAMFLPTLGNTIDSADAERALSALPPSLREVVTLRIWSALTFAEIAAVTGVPLSTVHDHYKSALVKVRQKLEAPCRNR